MRIDAFNYTAIDSDVYIHDFLFEDMQYNYIQNKITIRLINETSPERKEIIEFYNVIGFDMVACDFWGTSPYVLDWESIEKENQKLVKKFLAEKQNNNYEYARICAESEYVESIITFISGDRLTIACEYILYENV